jgi:2-polyprenyl-3-methyl-5-hydroxy-6-metoxy-1,4-benzoquinol methylase
MSEAPLPLQAAYCALCGGDETKPIRSEAGFAIVQCRGCGLIYPNPRLTPQGLADHYANQYYGAADSEADPRDLANFKIDSYRSGLRRLCDLDGLSRGTPLLDVGCGTGVFLELAREFGFDPVGVEVSERAAAFARERRRLRVVTGGLPDSQFAPQSFGVVTLWDVFEHIPDANQLLAELRKLLQPDGLLVIRVPNATFLRCKDWLLSRLLPRELLGSLLGVSELTMWEPREHLYNYNERTLTRMLAKHGFRVLRSELQETAHYGSRLRNLGHRLVYLAAQAVYAATRRNYLGPVVVLIARKEDRGSAEN